MAQRKGEIKCIQLKTMQLIALWIFEVVENGVGWKFSVSGKWEGIGGKGRWGRTWRQSVSFQLECIFPQEEKISDSRLGEVWVHDTLGILYIWKWKCYFTPLHGRFDLSFFSSIIGKVFLICLLGFIPTVALLQPDMEHWCGEKSSTKTISVHGIVCCV